MVSFAPWLPTALAVTLAVVAALCFATAAFLQQHAVTHTLGSSDGGGAATQTQVSVKSFHQLAQQPRWLAGWGLIGAASVLHVSALLLAPVSVVQPIGILAVPVAVVLAARAAHLRPPRPVVAGVALSVAGTGAFVVLAGVGVAPTSPAAQTLTGLLTALLVVAAVVVGFEVTARRSTGLARCLAYAGIGAVSFGCGSALISLISQTVTADTTTLWSPLVIIAGLAIVGALAGGAWAVQQAYASGPAAVVISALTVGDPLVAILLSAGLLGEGLSRNPATVIAMIASTAAAAWGVRLLASHHPAAAPNPAPEPARVLASVH